MKKNAFTLIELLAVIVILSIISLIATPVILGIINNVKEQAFKESINGIVRTAETNTILDIKASEELVYKYENNNWVENKLDLNGEIPEYVQIKVNKAGQTNYAITDGVYCAIKQYDSELKIKKISDKNDDKNIQKKYCKLETDESCFEYRAYAYTEGISINDYYCYEGNNNGYPEITDVEIPGQIDGKSVLAIQDKAFFNKNLTSVDFSLMTGLKTIGYQSFAYNNIIRLKNLDNCKKLSSIDSTSFHGNNLPGNKAFIYARKEINGEYIPDETYIVSYGGSDENVVIPKNVVTIGYNSFWGRRIKSLDLSEAINLKIIEGRAFMDSMLITDINFGECKSLEVIGGSAFWGAGRITNQKTFDLSVCKNLKTIGSNAFYMFLYDQTVILKDLTKLEKIGSGAFTPNGPKGIDLTNCPNLTEIGIGAFDSGYLTHIINGTGRSWNWNLLINSESGEIFEEGTIINKTLTDEHIVTIEKSN